MPGLAQLLPYIIQGLTFGAVYAVTGTGLVVLYRTTGVVNLAFGAIGTRMLDPGPDHRCRQVEISCHLRDRLALVQNQPNCPGLELIREAPTHTLLVLA